MMYALLSLYNYTTWEVAKAEGNEVPLCWEKHWDIYDLDWFFWP